MKKWYVVQIKFKQEQFAIDNLKNQGFTVYNPMVVETKTGKRDSKEIMSPLFSGYMFVSLDLNKDKWRSVCHTKGVYKLVTATDDGCTALPKGFVEGLKKRADIYGNISLEKANKFLNKYKVGEKVQISTGQFKGFIGNCTEIQKDKVTILFTLLNNKISIKLNRNQIVRVKS